ncbi:hypothetical protein [Paenibacillus ehimensis]|nr:hypothetical protein [Paenibacillus ehimensis]
MEALQSGNGEVGVSADADKAPALADTLSGKQAASPEGNQGGAEIG